MTHTDCWNDPERDEATITEVEEGAESWSITRSDGWSCCVKKEYGIEPRVGDSFVSWGRIGCPIRGQAINHRVLFYRTADEQEAENAKQRDEYKARKLVEYEAKRSEWDARVAALPDPLRERVEAFRAFKPEWRWDHEPYEVMCCEEAAKLAAHFATGDDIKDFARLDWQEQKAVYAMLDDGHSGNSWAFSLRLAWLLKENPELCVQEHGALCPLCGCEDYGCFAYREGKEAGR